MPAHCKPTNCIHAGTKLQYPSESHWRPPASLVPALLSQSPCSRRGRSPRETVTSSSQDPEPSHSVPPRCHPSPLPGSPKMGCLKIGSLLPLRLEAREVIWSGINPVACSLSTASENSSIAGIRKAGLTVAHAKRETLLKLAWHSEAGHRTNSSWAGQTSWQDLAPRMCIGNMRESGSTQPWPWAEGSSISTLSSCTQIQLFLFLFV